MKIYFSCSTHEFATYRSDYFAIRNCIVRQGHVLTRDWLPEYSDSLETGTIAESNMRQIYKAAIAAVKEAEAVIIDDTISAFSTGHLTTVALRARKPTLVLRQAVGKHGGPTESFIYGIEADLLQISEYNQENVENIIKAFISKFESVGQENRFHLVLDGVERDYLDWVSYNSGKSRTKAIREALRHTMDADEDYQSYLLSKS